MKRSPDAKDSVTKKLMPGMKNYAGVAEDNYARVVEYLRKLNQAGG